MSFFIRKGRAFSLLVVRLNYYTVVHDFSITSRDRGPVHRTCVLCIDRILQTVAIVSSGGKNNLVFFPCEAEGRYEHFALRGDNLPPILRDGQVRIYPEIRNPVVPHADVEGNNLVAVHDELVKAS